MEKVELGFRECWGLRDRETIGEGDTVVPGLIGGKEGKSLKSRREGTAGAHRGTSVSLLSKQMASMCRK